MHQSIINYLWTLIQILIGYNLVLPLILFFIYKTKISKLIKGKYTQTNNYDYAIIVTAFEQTDLLIYAINSILKLNYENYLIYVVADKCDVSNLKFTDDRIVLLIPEKILASNTGSHFYAIDRFKRSHDKLTIIDSDNLVHPNYLFELNCLFNEGFVAVQGVRKAKNLNTIYACLDAARDMYYHFFDGEIPFSLGSSSTLSGSGMAFDTELYKDCLRQANISGAGFDKVLQYEIVKRNKRIAFSQNAIVYDEKTSITDQLVKQRTRWINTWFKYFPYGFTLLGKGIKNLSINQFLFGVILLRPPLFIFLILSCICMLINLWFVPFNALIWLIALLCFIAAFFISMLKSNADYKIYYSFLSVPKFVFFQVLSLFKIGNTNKSVATKHLHHLEDTI